MPRFVDLQILFRRALALRAGRAVLRQTSQGLQPAPAFLAQAPQAGLATGSNQGGSDRNDPIQALADLDLSTAWPTHRIRCFLHAQPVRGLPRWR